METVLEEDDSEHNENGTEVTTEQRNDRIVPSGTYYSTDGFNQVFIFRDDKTVKMSALGIVAEGTYEITNGMITIYYSFLGDQVWQVTYERIDNSIFIAGTEFVKTVK